jgi:hypothetical protein
MGLGVGRGRGTGGGRAAPSGLIRFALDAATTPAGETELKIFTTRPDTLFGAKFMAVCEASFSVLFILGKPRCHNERTYPMRRTCIALPG